ncbi:MAG TPA: 7-cyano-7-deazaguanine synthase QueC [Acidimicrobiales bacterium]|nr:7-cyano-7-deazaguanine synthase QueC [Acidimicrobiales bacterium]
MTSLVVLSGGLDSTVCMAVAAKAGPVVALTFDYGQRHWHEIDHAAGVAGFYEADHVVVRLDLTGWGGSALTDASVDVPPVGSPGIPATYVPARNLIFLSVAMGVAEARDLDDVYLGVNALDYSGYPDCRPEFVESFQRTAELALKRGVEGRPVRVQTPLISLSKADIVRLGMELGAPLYLTWSCYQGGTVPCGACDSCALREKGFAEAGVRDPALLAEKLTD